MPLPWSFFHRLPNRSGTPLFNVNALARCSVIAVQLLLLRHCFARYIGWFETTDGISMMPTMPPRGNVIIYSSLHRRGRGIKVGDVVTYVHPIFPNTRGCKRVIGMPGDFVSVVSHARLQQDDKFEEDTKGKFAMVKEELIRVPEGHCWVQGDNLEWSRDSRLYGPLPLGLIKSKVLAVVMPLRDAKWVGSKTDLVDPVGKEREWVVTPGSRVP
ncbi:LepB Signal peptidase I [Pyrenophora tritici-repentis]|uniref:Mitochondrial inner membrane protease subunit n=1 Tax=Pyrenophora tritici-repentis TaxID=45151 RepID=A0A922NHX8_9PLEO|nr:peptidase S26 [Pyrenophora tritici-repentis]KAI1534985.1 LepB Signal peptidase I [Pyrenophora tritici-repentis]